MFAASSENTGGYINCYQCTSIVINHNLCKRKIIDVRILILKSKKARHLMKIDFENGWPSTKN